MKHLLWQLLLPLAAIAHSGGPQDMRTGAPGETTCTQCHNQFPLNSGDGSFNLQGPAAWEAGQTYELSVEIEDPGQSRWGFEITQFGIGDFMIADALNTQFSASGGRQYVKHTSSGTMNGTADGPVSWSLLWTAPLGPDLPDNVTFYAAGNAANGANGNQGDYIFTSQLSIPMAQPLGEVTDLAISTDNQQISLDWSPVAGAAGYEIHASSQPWGGFLAIDQVAAPGYTTAALPGMMYYRVLPIQ